MSEEDNLNEEKNEIIKKLNINLEDNIINFLLMKSYKDMPYKYLKDNLLPILITIKSRRNLCFNLENNKDSIRYLNAYMIC